MLNAHLKKKKKDELLGKGIYPLRNSQRQIQLANERAQNASQRKIETQKQIKSPNTIRRENMEQELASFLTLKVDAKKSLTYGTIQFKENRPECDKNGQFKLRGIVGSQKLMDEA